MIPAQFDYVRPADLDEALKILTEREGEAKLLAGGYSLIPLLKLRLAQPGLLVDLRDVAGLDGIVQTDDELRVGARATHRQIHEHPDVVARYPLLHDVSGGIGALSSLGNRQPTHWQSGFFQAGKLAAHGLVQGTWRA